MTDKQDSMPIQQDEVTNQEKPKNPKRVAWGKKLGQLNKGKKKVIKEEEQHTDVKEY